MKRDMDLLRNMLITIESCNDVPPNTLRIESFLDLCDQPSVISMHLELLKDAGLIEVNRIPRNDSVKGFEVIRITFEGYEYLDAIRNARIWRNVKDRIAAVGGATLDIIKAVAIEEIKNELHI